jgi:hypothetical protein
MLSQSVSDSTNVDSLQVHTELEHEFQNESSEHHPVRLGIVIGGSAGIVTIAHLQNYNAWWKGTSSEFHVAEDGTRFKHLDKLGHLLFTYVSSDIIGRSFIWAGVRPEKAFLYGGGLSLAFQTYVEIEDGFHPTLGFSFGDQIANTIGAGIPLLQYHYPFLRTFKFKWSAISSPRFQRGTHQFIFDDYESQYYWLSANIRELFRTSSPIIPSFLNLALGLGAKNLDFKGNGDYEIYLAFDVDMEKLPGEGDFLSAVKHALNYIHFPAPAIRFTPHVVFYGVRF